MAKAVRFGRSRLPSGTWTSAKAGNRRSRSASGTYRRYGSRLTRIVLGPSCVLDFPRPIVHVEILNPFSYQEFADDKQIVLDIRARDSDGRSLHVEMQVTVFGGLLQRLVYYACSLYVDQLEAGQNYAELRPAISICLLRQVLFRDSPVPHHRFRLVDTEQEMALAEAIEVHTVELTKYNLGDVESLSQATAIERWVFFFLFADQYEPARLRELLPDREFQQAVSVIEAIASKTEDRAMYDQRAKAQHDYLSAIEGARQEGLEAGREEGREEGLLAGKIQVIQQLLGEDSISTESLLSRSTEELLTMLSVLQERLRSRGD